MKIRKILIANRGEIALRIMRTCKQMGIRTAAVYSDADVDAPHVRFADESFHIGGAPASESYLDKVKIIGAVRVSGADAIHPGYGFLSENAEFVKMAEDAGITFIGPSSAAIRLLGDKTSARRLAKTLNIPMVPGIVDAIESPEQLKKISDEIGYPVLLKASAGGGGKGMRVVHAEAELASSFRSAQSEAKSSFGDDRVYVEKYIVNPRHVEVQILADSHGNVIHLGERECSIQRRHQKIVEESPSLILSAELRERITSAAVLLAREGGYANAGTVEFLLDATKEYYFMEMNTRIQVEHTVTETITGIDIVQEQIRIANGLELQYKQEDVRFRGYAIEFRINAEDPKNGFLPSFGKITRYYAPGGPGVRIDAAMFSGYEIPPYFDSMCAKLTVWALTWDGVVDRGRRALNDMVIYGVKTTIPYYQEILKHPDFRNADFNTGFVESHPELVDYTTKIPPELRAAAISAAIAAHEGI